MLRGVAYRLRYALSILDLGALALRPFHCALCGPSLLLRLSRDSIGVRCLHCAASAIALSMVSTLVAERPGFRGERVYELSSRGPCSAIFAARSRTSRSRNTLTMLRRRPCDDIQQLTYPDACFDLVTSTEVFEHVADDRKGFAEIRRVLRPGGAFIFTVAIKDAERTVERALLRDGKLPPAFHDDRIRGRGQVLVFRDYGRDIAGRLIEAGFGSAGIETRFERAFLGAGGGGVART